jgi:PAS domain S-box-containing protein
MSSSATAEPASAPPVETRTLEPQSQRENRARLHAILGAAGMVGWEWDVEANVVHHLGDIGGLTGTVWRKGDRFTHYVHPEDKVRFAEGLRDSWLNDTDYRQEFRIVRADGEVRWISDIGKPAIFPDGRRWMSGVLTDVTERKQAEAAANHHRARLDYALQAAGMTAWDWDPESGMVVHTADFNANTDARITDRAQLAERMHPDDRARVAEAFTQALVEGGEYRQEYRLRRPDGTVHWVSSRGRAVVGPDGRRRMSGVMSDITDRKAADQRRQLLVNELNHRVKNTLAIVQGVAAQTFRGRSDEAARTFQGRLMALSTAHNVLTRESWESASIQEIVADAVRPFETDPERPHLVVDGDDLRLPPKTAVALAMALHELGANAVKHGALASPTGQVSLEWRVVSDRLSLTWRESGGPPVTEPARRGFGTRMIERGLATELGGRVVIAFDPAGVTCRVDAPLPQAAPEPSMSESHA